MYVTLLSFCENYTDVVTFQVNIDLYPYHVPANRSIQEHFFRHVLFGPMSAAFYQSDFHSCQIQMIFLLDPWVGF
jgi:hypothetical protein